MPQKLMDQQQAHRMPSAGVPRARHRRRSRPGGARPRLWESRVLRRWLAEEALPGVPARPGIVGAHLGEADTAATQVRTDEKKLLQTPDAMARWLMLIEGVNPDAV